METDIENTVDTENQGTPASPEEVKEARVRKPIVRTPHGRARMIRKSLKVVNEHVSALRQSGWNVSVIIDEDDVVSVEITRFAQVVSL